MDMFCGSCGSPVAEGVRFCGNCGKPTAPASPAEATPVQSATPFPATPMQAAPSGQAAVPIQATASFQAAAPAPAFAPPPPPAAPLQDVGSPASLIGGFRLAGMGERLVAAILDMIVVGIIFAVAGMAIAARLGGATDSGFSLNGMPALITIGITCIAGFLYYWLAEGLFGATLGKGITGIQVREKTGARCNMKGSLIRNLLRIVDAVGVYLVGFLIAIFSKARQRLGDHVAGTIVVERNTPKALRIGLVIVWFAMIAGGLTCAYLIHRTAPEMVTGEFVALPSTIPMTATGRLTVGNFAFTEGKGGPARAAALYKPGDNVFIKYDVAGFARDAGGVPHLHFLLTALDPAGVPLHEPWTIRFSQPLDRGAPVNGTLGLTVPSFAPPGAYKIVTKVSDEVSNANLEMTPAFQVDAPAVAVPHGPEIRDLQLSRSENGPPETDPGFETGATVYMTCNVFGLQFQNDRTNASMNHKVFGPDGKVLLDTPGFVDLSESSYYRPATYRVHVHSQITIPSGMMKGVYTDQYSVVDSVSNQTITQEAKFEVR